MSHRPFLKPYSVVTNGNMASSITSAVTVINQISDVGYDISWTGTPTGSFSVQVSNTYSLNSDGTVNNPGNWTTLTLTGTVAAAGSADNGYIDVEGISAYAIRLVYTSTSGTGTLNAVICAKVF